MSGLEDSGQDRQSESRRRLPSALVPVLWALAACSSEAEPPNGSQPEPGRDTAQTVAVSKLEGWGPVVAELPPEAASMELSRRFEPSTFVRDPVARAWTAGRIGRVAGASMLELWTEIASRPEPPPSALELAALSFIDPPDPLGASAAEWEELEDTLWSRHAVTEDEAEHEALLLAIARLGSDRSVRRLGAELSVDPDEMTPHHHRAATEAMAILCVRGFALEAPELEALTRGLTAKRAEHRAASAYALSRCAAPSAEHLAGPERAALIRRLTPLAASSVPDEARAAWKAFAALGELPDPLPEPLLAGDSTEAWVEVEAVRALAGHADGRQWLWRWLETVELDAFFGGRAHVLLVALESLRPGVASRPKLGPIAPGLEPQLEAVQEEGAIRRMKLAALVRCELATLRAIASGELESLARCDDQASGLPDGYAEVLTVDALLHVGSPVRKRERIDALLALSRDPRSRVAGAALSALAEIDDSKVAARLQEALAEDDPGLLAAAAGAVAARSVDASRRDPEAVPMLVDLVERADGPRTIEARIAAIEALGNLARSRGAARPGEKTSETAQAESTAYLEDTVLELASDPAVAVRAAARRALAGQTELLQRFDAAAVHAPAPRFEPRIETSASVHLDEPVAGIAFVTEAGRFVVGFEGVPSPIAQGNLRALVADGFYEGLSFHRVVPGFVVQGGDPRGDGYGGPGWLVPCERSNLRYERGVVGIALAGKDTGGSQFFITHTAAPHLDGRYPVVGRVVDGMDVVDSLLPFDRIESAELLERLP